MPILPFLFALLFTQNITITNNTVIMANMLIVTEMATIINVVLVDEESNLPLFVEYTEHK